MGRVRAVRASVAGVRVVVGTSVVGTSVAVGTSTVGTSVRRQPMPIGPAQNGPPDKLPTPDPSSLHPASACRTMQALAHLALAAPAAAP